MSATPINYTPKKGAVAAAQNRAGGAYAEIDVPGDYEVVLSGIEDYDFTERGKSKGWLATFACETPSGGNVDFDDYMSFSEGARFKIDQFFEAFAPGLLVEEATNRLDPAAYVGQTVGAHIDFPRAKETNEPTSPYRQIQRIFAIVDEKEFFGDTVAVEGADIAAPAQDAEEVELI